jgi:hypothetical protein
MSKSEHFTDTHGPFLGGLLFGQLVLRQLVLRQLVLLVMLVELLLGVFTGTVLFLADMAVLAPLVVVIARVAEHVGVHLVLLLEDLGLGSVLSTGLGVGAYSSWFYMLPTSLFTWFRQTAMLFVAL